MDQIIVDISTVALSGQLPHIGEEAIIIGHQKDQQGIPGKGGDQSICCDEVATWAGTISYEIVCALGSRLPRIYNK